MKNHTLDQLERFSLHTTKYFSQLIHYKGFENQKRVFVAGMQRSGTNMLMDVLEQSYQTEVFHEHNPKAFNNYQMRDIPVIQGLAQKSRAPVVVLKSLCELDQLSDLMRVFYPAKTIWIVRDYKDVVNSMLRSFGNMAAQVARIVAQPDSKEWLAAGMSNETRTRISQLAHKNLDDTNASALQWYFRNILFFEQSFNTNRNVKLISYERLVTDPVAQFKSIFNFAGLEFSPRVTRKVSPRSIGKNTAPILEDPIKELCDDLLLRFNNTLK